MHHQGQAGQLLDFFNPLEIKLGFGRVETVNRAHRSGQGVDPRVLHKPGRQLRVRVSRSRLLDVEFLALVAGDDADLRLHAGPVLLRQGHSLPGQAHIFVVGFGGAVDHHR